MMWIFDSNYKGGLHLWARDRCLIRTVAMHPQSFYLLLSDPPAHEGMIEAIDRIYHLKMGYVVVDAESWEVDAEENASDMTMRVMLSCWRRPGRRWLLFLGSRIKRKELVHQLQLAKR
jgi:hypothetical protein